MIVVIGLNWKFYAAAQGCMGKGLRLPPVGFSVWVAFARQGLLELIPATRACVCLLTKASVCG